MPGSAGILPWRPRERRRLVARAGTAEWFGHDGLLAEQAGRLSGGDVRDRCWRGRCRDGEYQFRSRVITGGCRELGILVGEQGSRNVQG